jgi:hypothetical protein
MSIHLVIDLWANRLLLTTGLDYAFSSPATRLGQEFRENWGMFQARKCE